jgi:hypothetical protein
MLAISTAIRMRCGVHLPMEHIPGFTKPLDAAIGECLHRIAATVAMVDDLGRKHKTLITNNF